MLATEIIKCMWHLDYSVRVKFLHCVVYSLPPCIMGGGRPPPRSIGDHRCGLARMPLQWDEPTNPEAMSCLYVCAVEQVLCGMCSVWKKGHIVKNLLDTNFSKTVK